MKKFFPVYALGWLMVLVWLYGCAENRASEKKSPEHFSVVQPAIVDTLVTREYVAEIQSLQNVDIRTHVKGFIEQIHVDEGQAVTAGQRLFTLGNREFRENLLRATSSYKNLLAELKVAEVELKNTQTLSEKERFLFDKRLVADEPLTLADIGAEWGVSRERARQIEAALIARMKGYMREQISDFDLVAEEDAD